MKTLYSHDQFVPSEVKALVGDEKWRALIKMEPKDFIVEERTTPAHLCTTGEESDLDANRETISGKPGLVGVTVIKCRLTTYEVAYALAQQLGVSAHRVTYAGLKDYKAQTSSRFVIDGVHLDDVVALCGRKFSNDAGGWYRLKDATAAERTLRNGSLVSNRFTLNVSVPGRKAAEILDYVNGRLEALKTVAVDLDADRPDAERIWTGQQDTMYIANAYGGQRLGRRGNLADIGEELIRHGARAGIKRFLCESCGVERPLAKQIRAELADQWGWLEFFEKPGNDVEPTHFFQEMRNILERADHRTGKPVYQVVNLAVEHKIVSKLAEGKTYNEVMESMPKEFSLWIGAYQSYWFNQVLARVLRKEIALRGNGSIPLMVLNRGALGFYLRYCREALPLSVAVSELPSYVKVEDVPLEVDPEVRRLFLTPRVNENGRENSPWRKALIPVIDLKHSAEDGVWHCQFELRSGAYATVLLECLFELDQNGHGGNDQDNTRAQQRNKRGRNPGRR